MSLLARRQKDMSKKASGRKAVGDGGPCAGAMKTELVDQLATRLRAKTGRFWQQNLLLRSDPETFVAKRTERDHPAQR
jgi:hypothetical protein